jgi:hypothetical protein
MNHSKPIRWQTSKLGSLTDLSGMSLDQIHQRLQELSPAPNPTPTVHGRHLSKLTIAQLLAQTAGLPEYVEAEIQPDGNVVFSATLRRNTVTTVHPSQPSDGNQ